MPRKSGQLDGVAGSMVEYVISKGILTTAFPRYKFSEPLIQHAVT
jgi:hypothetical protein